MPTSPDSTVILQATPEIRVRAEVAQVHVIASGAGIQGIPGDQGPQGDPGPQGEQGLPAVLSPIPWGEDNDYGFGETVYYNGSTFVCIDGPIVHPALPPDTNPGSGGTDGATWMFVARAGADGQDGVPGTPGEQGEKGDPGDQGPQGNPGVDGQPGVDGNDGVPGPPGDPGAPGAPGTDGTDGSPGADGDPGPKGDQGDPGPKGDQGDPGPQGIQGVPGVDGDDGAPGAPGAPGAKGDKGDQGIQGIQGIQGVAPAIGMDSWHRVGTAGEPAFQNSWVNYGAGSGGPLRFRKYPDGKVRLSGLVKSGAGIIFTLPATYRPAGLTDSDLEFVCASGAGSGGFSATVSIATTGTVNVIAQAGATPSAWLYLDGIEFDTETVMQTASVAAQPIDPMHFVGAAGEPAFGAGFSNRGSGDPVVAFRKYPDGRVRIRGSAIAPAAFGTIFTLPSGYRPPGIVRFPCYDAAAGTLVECYVDAAGGVNKLATAGAGTVDLGVIEFDTETVANYATGVLPSPSPPLFQGQRSTDFAIGGSGYVGPLGFDELYDSDNWYNGTKFNPQRAGWYQIHVGVVFNGLGASNPEVILAKNGTIANAGTVAGVAVAVLATRADNWAGGMISKLVFMNGTTDYLEVYCFLATAGNVKGNANERTFFEGVFVRP